VIIIRGLNYYPTDIETTITHAHPALKINGCAAFSVLKNQEEHLVVVQEIERTYLRKLDIAEITAAVRQAIAETDQLQLFSLVLVKPGGVPKTSSGKIQRRTAKTLYETNQLKEVVGRWELSQSPDTSFLPKTVHPPHRLEDWLTTFCCNRFGISKSDFDPKEPLERYGMDSMVTGELINALEQYLGFNVAPGIVYDYPSVAALVTHFTEVPGQTRRIDSEQPRENSAIEPTADPIAVVGMGCRFPGANNLTEYWELLKTGRNAVAPISRKRAGSKAFYDVAQLSDLQPIVKGGFLDHIDQFDADFFGISPREAEYMDPQQRLLLEVSWETLEEGGFLVNRLQESNTGVFIGISTNDYTRLLPGSPQDYVALDNSIRYIGTGNAASIAANRLSYFYHWCGPSIAIDAACASSLLAIHQACTSLRLGECDLALAGGVNLIVTPYWSINLVRAGMLAPDALCKTFDAQANGYVRGEGCGLVLLQRLKDALRENRPIYALIPASGTNHNGKSNGLTAPKTLAQRDLMRRTLNMAHIEPDRVTYVEAHGTGTQLGDPIELQALHDVLSSDSDRKRVDPCWVGSVKTNIGHLESAAGIAGLIKVILAIQNQVIPPHLHLSNINPKIAKNSTLIPDKLEPWKSDGPRVATVSSFGFGGSNACVIVEEPPKRAVQTSTHRTPPYVLAFSAKSHDALKEVVNSAIQTLDTLHPDASFGAFANAVCTRRSPLSHRMAIVASHADEFRNLLLRALIKPTLQTLNENGALFTTGYSLQNAKVTFVFDGEDQLSLPIARELYETEPLFRAALERCSTILPEVAEVTQKLIQEAPYSLDENRIVSFVFKYALTELWKHWGVIPRAVISRGNDRYIAACVACVFPLETALKLVIDPFLQKFPDLFMTSSLSPSAIPFFHNGLDKTPLVNSADYWMAKPDTTLQPNPDIDHNVSIHIGTHTAPEMDSDNHLTIPSLSTHSTVARQLADATALLFTAGIDISWQHFYRFQSHEIPLGTYPFQRKKFWVPELPSVESRSIPDLKPRSHIRNMTDSDCLYEIVWEQSTLENKETAPQKNKTWIVLNGEQGVGALIAEKLRRSGSKTVLHSFPVNSAFVNDAKACSLIQELCSSNNDFHILICQSTDLSTRAFDAQSAIQHCFSVFEVFQILRKIPASIKPRISLITQAGESIGTHLNQADLTHSMWWGLGRSLSLEWPDLWGGLHHLSTKPTSHELENAIRKLETSSIDQVVWQDSLPYVPRLIQSKNSAPLKIDPNGAYWITGGTGALGSLLTQLLLDRHPGLIVLTARGEKTKELDAFIQCAPSKIWYRKADCTVKEELRQVAQEISKSGFALRGIFHTAGIGSYDDSNQLTYEKFNDICSAKVKGAWALHELTLHDALDYFVMFSSIASVWGAQRQAHYAAANYFLDALAWHRSNLLLPALSINWGPWANSMVDISTQQNLDNLGIKAFSPENTLTLLETAVSNRHTPQLIAAHIDFSRFAPLFDSFPRADFFRHVAQTPQEHLDVTLKHITRISEEIGTTENIPITQVAEKEVPEHVGKILGELLGYDVNRQPDPNKGFFDLGMDSIMAIDFYRRLCQDFNCSLPSTIAFDHPNVTRLSQFLKEHLYSSAPESLPTHLGGDLPFSTHAQPATPVHHLIEDRLKQLESLLGNLGR
jgi:acyl transferase domain-containing protein/acyl carrier protein